MYLFSGTSFGHIIDDTAPPSGWPQKTIFDALDQAKISWRYYVQDSTLYLSQWATYAQNKDHVSNISNWYTDVQQPDTLPNVIFIERAGATGLDEHPPNNIQKGAANTKKILDALMQSPSWGSSAFIFTFDEGDGLYDHVPPAALPAPDNIPPMLKPGDEPGDFTESGQRVPFIMISPWIRPHYVSHVIRDHTSILKFIETRFSLPALTKRDAAADDMTELFDFSQAHLATAPVLPDQPVNGLCSISREKAPGF
jgi:phospholipase C